MAWNFSQRQAQGQISGWKGSEAWTSLEQVYHIAWYFEECSKGEEHNFYQEHNFHGK